MLEPPKLAACNNGHLNARKSQKSQFVRHTTSDFPQAGIFPSYPGTGFQKVKLETKSIHILFNQLF